MKFRVRHIFEIAALVALALLLVMVRFAGAAPVQRNLTVRLAGMPAGTPPLRIAVLSDLHTARIGDTPKRLRETIARVSALQPDLVLIAGDFMTPRLHGGYAVDPSVAPLAGLKAPLGVFAVLGNHDYRDSVPAVLSESLHKLGIEVLDNSAARAGPLTIIGVSDSITDHDKPAQAFAAARVMHGVPVVLSHTPDIMARLPQTVELAFAGHTHCGQIVLPVVGVLDWGTRYGARFGCGVVREGSRINVITAGLGVSNVPLRLGAPPDFWVVTVLPAAPFNAKRVQQ
jgi:predicted MPP superfamily phosphohydrolase